MHTTQLIESKVTEIYCIADDFYKKFAAQQENYLVEEHSRHKAFHNFAANLLGGIAAACFILKISLNSH